MSLPYRDVPAVLDVEERITSADARVPAGWVEQAAQAVRQIGAHGPFTAADLRRAGIPEPPHHAHWGALVCKLRNAGIIRPHSTRLEYTRDGLRPVRVWQLDDRPEPGREAS